MFVMDLGSIMTKTVLITLIMAVMLKLSKLKFHLVMEGVNKLLLL